MLDASETESEARRVTCQVPFYAKERERSSNGTVVDFQAFLISCLARDLGTGKCLYCLGRFLIKRGSILPGRLATRQLAIFSSMVWA